MYAYAVLLPEMAKDLGLTLSEVFGVLSLGLFFGGLVSPIAGKLVDQFGGRWVMTIGSVVASFALMAMSLVESRFSLFALILLSEGAGMFVLYNVAFASVARLNLRVLPQRSISVITLFGTRLEKKRSSASAGPSPRATRSCRSRTTMTRTSTTAISA